MGDRSILQDTVPEVEDMGALGKGRKDAPGGLFHRLATGKFLPMGLYGCETTAVNQIALEELTRVVLAVLQGRDIRTDATMRCV